MNFNLIEQNVGDELVRTVSARELQEELGNSTSHPVWIKRAIDAAYLVENIDLTILLTPVTGGTDRKDYYLTIEAAKSIAMMQRSEIGKKVRDYFINIEKEYKNSQANNFVPMSPAQQLYLQAQWNMSQEQKLLAVEKTVEGQAIQLEEVNDDIAMVVKEIEGVKKLVLDSSISLSEIYADENAVFEIGEVAGMLIGSGYFSKEKDFRLYLLEKKLCYKHGQNHYYPMARLLKEGYVKVIPVKVGTRVFSATHFTPRGISWIVKRLQKEQQRELDLGYVESDSVPVLVDSSPITVVRGF